MTVRKRKSKTEGEINTQGWMTTYSDMVTLLLCFFILLFSYSVVDVQKFQQVLSSIQLTFLGSQGLLDAAPALEAPPDEGQSTEEIGRMEQIIMTYQAIQEYLRQEGLDDAIKARIEERGIVLEIQDRILFDSGKAEIKEEAKEILAKVSGILRSVNNMIIVEGHTDNVPINTVKYPSNWELSVDRAVQVVKYLSSHHHIAPQRFIATGYGEYHPVADNSTVEGRARNRRVNIVISEVNLLDKEAQEN